MYRLKGKINRSEYTWTSRRRFSDYEEARIYGEELEQSNRMPIGTVSWEVENE